MRIVLKKNVPALGEAGAVKEVAAGYARNYLLPYGFAVLATKPELKALEQRAALEAKAREAMLKDAKVLADKLAGLTLNLAGEAEKDTLYGSIGAPEVAAALSKMGLPVPAEMIDLKKPLKKTGEYTITLKLAPKVEAQVKLRIQAETASKAKPKAAKTPKKKLVKKPTAKKASSKKKAKN